VNFLEKKEKIFSVKLNNTERERLEVLAATEERTKGDIVRRALRFYELASLKEKREV